MKSSTFNLLLPVFLTPNPTTIPPFFGWETIGQSAGGYPKAATINRRRVSLVAWLNWPIATGPIEYSLTEDLKIWPPEVARPRWLSQAEQAARLKANASDLCLARFHAPQRWLTRHGGASFAIFLPNIGLSTKALAPTLEKVGMRLDHRSLNTTRKYLGDDAPADLDQAVGVRDNLGAGA